MFSEILYSFFILLLVCIWLIKWMFLIAFPSNKRDNLRESGMHSHKGGLQKHLMDTWLYLSGKAIELWKDIHVWCFYPLCWSLMIMTNMTFASFSAVYSPSVVKASSLLLHTCDEKLFGKNLEQGQTKLKHQRRTSSPVDFESFVLNSVPTDISELQSCQPDISSEVKGEQLLTCGSFKVLNKAVFFLFLLEFFLSLLSFCRFREAPGRDCLPTGQEDSVPHLPGSKEALWFHTA